MFHRVKPEAPQDASPQSQAQSESRGPEIRKFQPPSQPAQAAAPIETEAKRSPAQPQRPQQEKDTKTMSDQDRQDDSAESSTQASPRRMDIPGASSYQRPQSAMRPGGYPGAYPGAAATTFGASQRPDMSAMSPGQRTLTIGSGITMSGEIESCDYLLVEGTVEAVLKGASVLDIAESGTFYGTVEIDEATIAGRFEGDIKVSGRLVIRSGGVIMGSLAYKELEVESGAIIDGRLTPMSGAQADTRPAASKAKSIPSAPVKPRPKDEQSSPANSEDGLFSKTAAAAE
jgi:cytoskeletal protein CcmA (bactofilin family)